MNNSIQTIASSSEVSKAVFKALSDKQRARRATDLTNLFREVSAKDKTIPEKEFLTVFKKLEEAKLGSLVIGRRNKHNRFLWNYNLKQVAQAAHGKVKPEDMGPAVEVRKPKSRRIRKPTVLAAKTVKSVMKNVSKQIETAPIQSIQEKVVPSSSTGKGPMLQFNIELSATTRAEDIQALLGLVQDLQKTK